MEGQVKEKGQWTLGHPLLSMVLPDPPGLRHLRLCWGDVLGIPEGRR